MVTKRKDMTKDQMKEYLRNLREQFRQNNNATQDGEEVQPAEVEHEEEEEEEEEAMNEER